MSSVNFDSTAKSYEEIGLVQKAAADILLYLAEINGHKNVLDLGCGPGNITAKIARLTKGKVVGVDLSAEMIKTAQSNYGSQTNLDFQVKDAVTLEFINEFDTIFCNSAFQWFQKPNQVLTGCLEALKPGGSMLIQAPATAQYCPVFVEAIEKIAIDPKTSIIFSHFHSPFFMLETADEYTQLFTKNGFKVDYSQQIHESNRFSAEQVFGIFQSGAENAYLNQAYYDIAINDVYINTFRSIIRDTMQSFADQEGLLDLSFIRIFLKASRPF